MSTERVDLIRKFISDQTMNLEPQEVVNVLAEVVMDCDSQIDALREEHDVEPE